MHEAEGVVAPALALCDVAARGFVSREDLDLYLITDDVGEAVREILNFYSNYHSSGKRGDRMLLRVRKLPNAEELEVLNAEFADIVSRGGLEVDEPRPTGDGESPWLSSVVFDFDRRSWGRLRQLIDALNELVADEASPPVDASPHEIVQIALTDRAEAEEEA